MSGKKQYAIAAKRPAASGAPAGHPGAREARRRSLTRDKWERQAVEAAQRVSHGARNVARMLTPAPAASFRAPSSRGEPLPIDVRSQLEEGFGADLSTVRIHRDAHANRLVHNEHAAAFTSGRDLYFASGTFATTTTTGRQLLAHEIAHALQQTGRRSFGGTTRASEHQSWGTIQCFPGNVPDFETLQRLHAPSPGNSKASLKFEAVKQQLAKSARSTDAAGALETFFHQSLKDINDWPEEAESLFYDTLKRYGKLDLSAQLIERDDFKGGARIRTAGLSDDLELALERRNHGSAVYVRAAEKHPALIFYIKEFVRLIEVFIFQPVDAPIPEMRSFNAKIGDKNPKTIEDHANEVGNRRDDHSKVSSSEWVYHALKIVNGLNHIRMAKCVEINNHAAKETTKAGDLNILLKRRLAEGVRDWGNHFLASTEQVFDKGNLRSPGQDKTAWQPFLNRLGAQIADVGRAAIDVWDRKKSIYESLASYIRAGNAGDEAAAIQGLTQVKTSGEKSGLPKELIRVLAELNRGVGEAGPPPPAEYSKRCRSLRRELTAFSAERLERQQSELFRQKKTDEVVADIWLSIWVSETGSNLGWMGQESNIKLIDVLIAQRIGIAKRIKSLAKPLGWADVVSAADVILHAEKEKKSQLAILPYADGKFWHRDEKAPIEELQKFGTITIKGLEPLNGRLLALLYRTRFYEQLADEIVQRTPYSDADERQRLSEDYHPFIAGQAADKVRTLPQPERWIVRESALAKYPGSDESIASVIERHHSVAELHDYKVHTGKEYLLPTYGDTPFVWFVPPLSEIVPSLRTVTILNDLVDATLRGKATKAKKLAPPIPLDDAAWLRELTKAVAGISSKQLEALQKTVSTALETQQGQTWSLVQARIRKSLRFDRQLIARLARSPLNEYAGNPRNPQFTEKPFEAFYLIVKFYGQTLVLEEADRNYEMTALFLDLAPAIASTFEKEERFDVAYSYLGFLESAVKFLPAFQATDPRVRHEFLPDYQNTEGWIQRNASPLKEVMKHFQQVRERRQMSQWYKASVSNQTFKVSMAGSSPIEANTPLYPREGPSILGDPKNEHYQVTAILKNYIYHPAYGYSSTSKTAPTGYAPAKFLELDDKTPLRLKPGKKLLTVEKLNRKDEVLETRDLGTGPEDAEWLADIDNGLAWAAFGSEMENINVAIEKAVNVALDAAEFIPGVGQAVTAGRVVLTVEDFLNKGGYDAIKQLVNGGFKEIVNGLLDAIEKTVDPERLLQLLLFGDPVLNKLADLKVGGAKSGQKSKKWGRLWNIIDAFRRLGRGVVRRLKWLKSAVWKRMQDVRAFIALRPVLSFAFHFIADHLTEVRSKLSSFFEIVGPNPGARNALTKSIKEQQAALGKQIHQILDRFQDLQLPQTIVDFQPIYVEVLTKIEDFVVQRLGRKAKAVFYSLQEFGALSYLNGLIAKGLIEVGADPNRIWTEKIVPAMAEKLSAAQRELVRSLNRELNSHLPVSLFDAIPTPEKVTLLAEGGPFEESELAPEKTASAQPYPATDRRMRLRPAGIHPFGSGQPLGATLRRRAELAFGQDFRHVRLHTGSESSSMTEAFGVDALATGSHIFLRPGLTPMSGRGDKIFRHELVHVLQQTGVRSLGDSGSLQPDPGHPELGLDFDPEREQAADRISAAANPLNGQSLPLGEGRQKTGFEPNGLGTETVQRLLRSFVDLEQVAADIKPLEDLRGEAKLPASVKSLVDDILDSLKTLKGIGQHQGVFTEPVKNNWIQNRLKDATYAKPIRLAALKLASEVLEDSSRSKPAKSAKAPSDTDKILKSHHFARRLEEFIFFKTGILLDIKLNAKKDSKSGPFENLKIVYIHLPFIDGRSPLWQSVVKNTWKKSGKPPDEKTIDKIRVYARAHAKSLDVVPGIWALTGNEYVFSKLFKEQVDKQVEESGLAGALEPGKLSSPSEYVRTDGSPLQIGVRLAKYSDGAGTERNAHHLTQYLLAEYFANQNASKKPFNPRRKYPGVTFKDGVVDLISPTAKANESSSIKVRKTEVGRGGLMPTISLSTPTHRNASLHITQNHADDLRGETGHTFPSTWVDEKFSLPEEVKASATAVSENDDKVAKKIYLAVQSVYKAVESDMSKRLSARMPKYELQYYKDKAASEGADLQFDIRDKANPDRLNTKGDKLERELGEIPALARKHNEKGMNELGWKLNP